VARDGIEPPTPAFSGLDSFRAIIFITKGERSRFVPKSAHLLGQEWDKTKGRSKFASPLLSLSYKGTLSQEKSLIERALAARLTSGVGAVPTLFESSRECSTALRHVPGGEASG
jgi:hypothetical protein